MAGLLMFALMLHTFADQYGSILFFKNGFRESQRLAKLKQTSTFFYAGVIVCFTSLQVFYLYRLTRVPASPLNAKDKLSTPTLVWLQSVSLLTVGMVAVPVKNQTLEFVIHNGSVNLYLLLLSHLFCGEGQDEDAAYAEKTLESDRITESGDDRPKLELQPRNESS